MSFTHKLCDIYALHLIYTASLISAHIFSNVLWVRALRRPCRKPQFSFRSLFSVIFCTEYMKSVKLNLLFLVAATHPQSRIFLPPSFSFNICGSFALIAHVCTKMFSQYCLFKKIVLTRGWPYGCLLITLIFKLHVCFSDAQGNCVSPLLFQLNFHKVLFYFPFLQIQRVSWKSRCSCSCRDFQFLLSVSSRSHFSMWKLHAGSVWFNFYGLPLFCRHWIA